MATTTATEDRAEGPAAGAPACFGPDGSDQRVALRGISWATYLRISEEMGGKGPLTAYHAEVLEFLSPGGTHEFFKKALERFVMVLAEELNVPHRALGSTGWKRPEVERGVESDACYFFSADKLAAIRRLPRRAPASDYPFPDLAVEIDMSPRAVDRAGIYAALGVAEVWRFDGETFRVERLEGEPAAYRPAPGSAFLPVTAEELRRWLLRADEEAANDLVVLREFRAWVRSGVVPRRPAGP